MQPDVIKKRRVVSPAAKSRPQITINGCQLRDLAARCMEALTDANDPPHLFARGGGLAYVKVDEHGQNKAITGVTPPYLASCLTAAADFVRIVKDGQLAAADPPGNAVSYVLARPEELGAPPLVGITETPILREDGSVLDQAGYDPATRMLYAPDEGLVIPPIPKKPTRDDALEAFLTIHDPISEFPFDCAASMANMHGLLVTPLVRPLIRGCVPMALIEAPQPGTGKGLLVEVLSLIHTGSAAAWFAAGCPPAETRVIGSFESWSRVVGGILAYADIRGFLENLPNLYEQADVVAEQWEAFLREIFPLFRDRSFTVKELVTTLQHNPSIRETVPEELEAAFRKQDHQAIGIAFRKLNDRRFGERGFHLAADRTDRTGSKRWTVQTDSY